MKSRRHAAGTGRDTPDRRHHRGRTRHHSATPHTYSHHHTHVFMHLFFRTRPFRTRATTRGTKTRPRRPLRPRHSQGPPPGRTQPTGRRPGAPRGSRRHRTHLGRTGPPGGRGPVLYGSARARALRPRAAVPSAAAGARSAPSTPPTPPRAAPSSAAAAVAVPAAQSRCTCVHGAFTDGQSESMMGSRAPSSRRCGGRAPSEARGIRPSRYRPDGPGTPRGGRLDRGRPAGPQDGPAGPPHGGRVSECEHWHRWSGTCARLARTVLPSIHTSMPICRRPWSTSHRHPVCTRHARTHSSGQSDFSGPYPPTSLRTHAAGIFRWRTWSGRARRCRSRIGARTL